MHGTSSRNPSETGPLPALDYCLLGMCRLNCTRN